MESFKEGVIGECDSRAVFVSLLKDNSILLSKSMLPQTVTAKERAWENVSDQFGKNTGKVTSVSQLKKLLNNMKSAIKKKTDVNATGNKAIKLLPWETDFMKILECNENPVFCKTPGALCIGLDVPSASASPICISTDENEAENGIVNSLPVNQPVKQIDISQKRSTKKVKLSAETNETSKLTTGQLQRLLLLEQIKLTRLQSQRESMLIAELESKNGNPECIEQRQEKENSVSLTEVNGELQEFLVL